MPCKQCIIISFHFLNINLTKQRERRQGHKQSVRSVIDCPLLLLSSILVSIKHLSRNWLLSACKEELFHPCDEFMQSYIAVKRSWIFSELYLLCIRPCCDAHTCVRWHDIDVYASLSLFFSWFVRCNTRGPSSSPTKHVINRCHWSLMRERNKNVPRGSDYSRDSFHEEAGLLVLAPKET